MLRIESIDGKVYEAPSATEVVKQMREDAWGGSEANGVRGYMKQVAKRIYDWNKAKVRHTNARHFIKDLAKAKIITIHDNGEGALEDV